LLARDINRLTAWDFAGWRGNKELLEKLWGWDKEMRVNLKDDLLLAKCSDGLIPWYIAARKSNNKLLEKTVGLG